MSASLAAFERPLPRAPNMVIKSGPLFMSPRGRGWRLWKKRWFVLTRTSLVFFKNDPSVLPQRVGEVNLTLGGIDLNNSGSVVVRENKKLLTVIFSDGRDGQAFTVKAETSEDLYEWKAALEHALGQAPSAFLVMGHNGIFRNDTSNAREGSFPNQWMGKHSVKSLVVGRPFLLALEDIDGSPSFLEKALQFIENFGIKVEGILQQSADVQEVECRVQEYEQGKTEFGPEEDAHVVGDCIKYVLQELPSSPVPAFCCRALLEAYKIDQNEARVSAMRSAIFETFPLPNLRFLLRLLEEYENFFYVSAEEWLTEETRTTQHAEFVSNMYLQVAEQRHQRGFNYMVLQKGGYLIKMSKPGLVSSDIQSNIKGLTETKKWGEEQQLFSLHKGSWRSTDPSFKESSYRLIEEDETVGDEERSRSNDLSLLENSHSSIEEDELLGIESQKEEIVSMLVGVPSSHLAISLVGIGGVGKTALASVVYQSEEVQQHFDFHAWINVTESHRFENLFRHLTRMICKDGDSSEEEMDAMEEQELIYHLKQRLSTKRYLIVFDDVWRIDFWEVMNNVFPDSKNGSRIIITTRNNAIAASSDTLMFLQPLSKEMAWELFCKRAFKFENGNCPHELLELSLEIVRRCHGLPLVIKAIAGLLSSKMNVSEWKVLLNHFNDGFIENPRINSVVSIIISHSYDDLPFHVKLCFLYFGIFTNNIPIPEQRLRRLWIAKGFVKEEIGKTLKQVAKMYLNELINRNLVQVSHVRYDGAERICRVHGFMHEILVAKSRQLDIFQVEFASTSTSVRGEESASASIFQQIDINRLSFSSDRVSFFSDDIED